MSQVINVNVFHCGSYSVRFCVPVNTTFMLYFLGTALEYHLLRPDWPYHYLPARFSPTAFHGKVS